MKVETEKLCEKCQCKECIDKRKMLSEYYEMKARYAILDLWMATFRETFIRKDKLKR